jgi:hypothetical protein
MSAFVARALDCGGTPPHPGAGRKTVFQLFCAPHKIQRSTTEPGECAGLERLEDGPAARNENIKPFFLQPDGWQV